MELKGNLAAFVAKIEGLRAVLSEPIQSVVIPGNDTVTSGPNLSFNNPQDFLDIISDSGALDMLDGATSAHVENGILSFNAPMANKG